MTQFLINALINLILLIDTNGLMDYDSGSLTAWADPTDDEEAIYLHAPEGTCSVTLNPDTEVITIHFSDACEAP